MFNEIKRLHLENRLSKLSAKPVENMRLINKIKRQIHNLDRV